jgi:hypothetical protein
MLEGALWAVYSGGGGVVSDKPYPNKSIVWRVSYKGRSAEVYLGGPLPGWAHEHADKCRWKILKGEHLL